MSIIEVFTTLMLACNQVPEKCAIIDNPEQMITAVMIYNEDLVSSQKEYDFILFTEDAPDESRHIYISPSCVDV